MIDRMLGEPCDEPAVKAVGALEQPSALRDLLESIRRDPMLRAYGRLEAEDVLQEIMCRALDPRKPPLYGPANHWKLLARNRLRDLLRKQTRLDRRHTPLTSEVLVGHATVGQEEVEEFQSIVAQMDPYERRFIDALSADSSDQELIVAFGLGGEKELENLRRRVCRRVKKLYAARRRE